VIALLLTVLALAADPAADESPADPAPSPAIEGPDRSAPPPVEPAEPLDQPSMERRTVRPGLEVVLVRTPGMRKARISLMFRRGSRQLGGRGSASYEAFGWVWDQATRDRRGEELTIYEATHDVDVWSTSSRDVTTVHLDAPLTELGAGLELLSEVVRRPRFQRRDLRLIRESRIRWFSVEAPTDGGALLSNGLDHLWVPEGHALSARPDVGGWLDLKKRQLKRHHRDLLDTAPLTVVVVGDLAMQDVDQAVLPWLDGLGVPGDIPEPVPLSPPATDQVLGVDLYGTGRASLGLRLSAPALEHPDAPAFRLIDHAMGGHFLSRLNAELREERGLVYGIESRYGAGRSAGTWTLLTEVSVGDAQEAITVIREQLDALAQGGLTEAELADGVQSRISGWNATLMTTGRAANVFASRARLGWSTRDARRRLDRYGQVTPQDSRRVARAWLAEGPRAWVIVGERSELEPQLEALGLEVQWLPGELVVLGRGVGPEAKTQGR